MKLFYLGVFGLLGVYARYFSNQLALRYVSASFPAGTLLVNVAGAFLIGLAYVYGVERALISYEIRFGLMVGFLGGFTTFSSYSLEAVNLATEGKYSYALAYLVLSPVLGVMFALGGMALARKLLGGMV